MSDIKRFRRGPGGPREKSDREGPEEFADDARRRLLTSARKNFGKHGFAGASLRLITNDAWVNLGAVNYYFENKEKLYMAVLQEIIGPLGPRVEFATRRPVPPLERALGIVRVVFEHIRLYPDLPAIISREMASDHEIPYPITNAMGRGLKALTGVIADGQKDGTIRKGDPTLLALSCVSQPVYLNLAKRAISAVAGVDVENDRVVEHAVSVVEAFLKP